ncbi:hypothetical protein TSUD_59940 [Trifolium subterraneum]|uniref:Replication factor A C-terminal domain-containing protein n=1 Tax=Trifolium subterraneum TaxID=3900 RepID=A0A2Z6P5P7_TRISU|nr:hypothetical protein TSUD_59940 [Trifolium subterraneum]
MMGIIGDNDHGCALKTGILDFIGGNKIMKIVDLCNVAEGGVAIIIACYFSVVEGVDMWYVSRGAVGEPRFRLEIEVGDETDEIVLNLYDDVVRKAAPRTCRVLQSMIDGSTAYPDELDETFGDPVLFRVRKDYQCDSCGVVAVDVLDVYFDSSLLEIYLNPNHSAYDHNVVLHDEKLFESITDDHTVGIASGSLGGNASVVDKKRVAECYPDSDEESLPRDKKIR